MEVGERMGVGLRMPRTTSGIKINLLWLRTYVGTYSSTSWSGTILLTYGVL